MQLLLIELKLMLEILNRFSYKKKHENRWQQEKDIISSVFRKYDLSINLTASDRSVLFAFFASKNSISAIEKDNNISPRNFTLGDAQRREKEIKHLFKEVKWAKYFDESIEKLRYKIIMKLINSNLSLQQIKTNIKLGL